MPPKAANRYAPLAFQDSELNAQPSWARTEYRNTQNILTQLVTQVVKLESNIAQLESMMEKDECPRSLHVNVKVDVNEAQQGYMNEMLNNAKKQFEKTVLAGLITARKAELASKQTEARNKKDEFQEFLTRNYQALQQNNIPLLEEDDDPQVAIQTGVHEFQKRAEKVAQEVRTQHFFQQQKLIERRQAREVAAQEQRLNAELEDPHVKNLMVRVDFLERSIKKQNPQRPTQKQDKGQRQRIPRERRRPNPHQKKDNDRQVRRNNRDNTPRKYQQTRYRPDGQGSRPFRNRAGRSPKDKGAPPANQDRARGNREPQRRFTNTMNRSGSRPPNSRRRQG